MLGHASATLTLDRYGHLFPDEMDALAASLDEAPCGVGCGPDVVPDRISMLSRGGGVGAENRL